MESLVNAKVSTQGFDQYHSETRSFHNTWASNCYFLSSTWSKWKFSLKRWKNQQYKISMVHHSNPQSCVMIFFFGMRGMSLLCKKNCYLQWEVCLGFMAFLAEILWAKANINVRVEHNWAKNKADVKKKNVEGKQNWTGFWQVQRHWWKVMGSHKWGINTTEI